MPDNRRSTMAKPFARSRGAYLSVRFTSYRYHLGGRTESGVTTTGAAARKKKQGGQSFTIMAAPEGKQSTSAVASHSGSAT